MSFVSVRGEVSASGQNTSLNDSPRSTIAYATASRRVAGPRPGRTGTWPDAPYGRLAAEAVDNSSSETAPNRRRQLRSRVPPDRRRTAAPAPRRMKHPSARLCPGRFRSGMASLSFAYQGCPHGLAAGGKCSGAGGAGRVVPARGSSPPVPDRPGSAPLATGCPVCAISCPMPASSQRRFVRRTLPIPACPYADVASIAE